MWFSQWFQPFSLMQKLLNISIVSNPYDGFFFIFSVISGFNQSKKRSYRSLSLKKGSIGFELILQFLSDNPVQKFSVITVNMKWILKNDYKKKSMIKMSLLRWVWLIS